jgi:hypothetical protein
MKPCIRYVAVNLEREKALLEFLAIRGSAMDFSSVRFPLDKEQVIYVLCCYPETADGLEKFGVVLAKSWKELPVEIKRKIGKRLETTEETAARQKAEAEKSKDGDRLAISGPMMVAANDATDEKAIVCPVEFAGVDE